MPKVSPGQILRLPNSLETFTPGPVPRLAISWGSAVGGSAQSQIYAAVVTLSSAR